MSKKGIREAKTTKARVTAAAMEFVEAAVLSYEAGGAAGTMRLETYSAIISAAG